VPCTSGSEICKKVLFFAIFAKAGAGGELTDLQVSEGHMALSPLPATLSLKIFYLELLESFALLSIH
jgi:hypothetical protein